MCDHPAYCSLVASHSIGESNVDPASALWAQCGLTLPAYPTQSVHILRSLALYLLVTKTSLFLKNTRFHPPTDLGTCCSRHPQTFLWKAPSHHRVSSDVSSQRPSLATLELVKLPRPLPATLERTTSFLSPSQLDYLKLPY